MTDRPSTRAPEAGRSSLRYLADIDGPTVRVTLRGRLDVDTVWSFGAELLALIRAGRRHLSVDLSQLEHVSTICVGVANRAVSELKSVDGTLTLSGADDALVRRLRAAGLHPSVITPAVGSAATNPGKRERGLSDTA
jgi:anti-anti-sigma factor